MTRSTLAHWSRTLGILGFHIIVIVTPFLFTWVNEELFEFNKMLFAYAMSSWVVGCWLTWQVLQSKWTWRRTPLDIPIALFVLGQVCATAASMHPRTSWLGYYTRFHGGLLSTLSYVGMYYAFVNLMRPKQLPRFLVSLLLAASAAALYAIPEHFGLSPSCWLITNGQEGGVSCWIQDVKSRVFGTFGQPNWLAAYAITLIPLGLSWPWLRPVSLRQSWLNTAELAVGPISAVLLMMALLFTQSRSGLLGLGLGLVIWCGGAVIWWTRQRRLASSAIRQSAGWVSLATGATMLLALLWWGSPLTPSLASLTRPVASLSPSTPVAAPAVANRLDIGGTDSGEIRRIVWQGAWDVWKRYPVFGSGVETFAYSYYQDRPVSHNLVSEWDFLYNKAHNEFLNYLATTGLVGLAGYCIMLAAFLLYATWLWWETPVTDADAPQSVSLNRSWLGLSVVAGLAGLSVSNFLGFSTVMVTILMYLLPATLVVAQRRPVTLVAGKKTTTTRSTRAPSIGQWSMMGIILMMELYALSSVWNWWQADFAFATGKNLIRSGALTPGLSRIEQSIQLSPQEPLFYDELASTYSQVAIALANQGDATTSAQVAELAIQYSDAAIKLNPRQLNFYRTRARLFISLSQLDSQFLDQANQVLQQALKIAPTEAKLWYNLGLVQLAAGDTTAGLATLKHTIDIKPNYESARFELGKQYETLNSPEQALQQYEYILQYINPENQGVQAQLQKLQASISANKARSNQ